MCLKQHTMRQSFMQTLLYTVSRNDGSHHNTMWNHNITFYHINVWLVFIVLFFRCTRLSRWQKANFLWKHTYLQLFIIQPRGAIVYWWYSPTCAVIAFKVPLKHLLDVEGSVEFMIFYSRYCLIKLYIKIMVRFRIIDEILYYQTRKSETMIFKISIKNVNL